MKKSILWNLYTTFYRLLAKAVDLSYYFNDLVKCLSPVSLTVGVISGVFVTQLTNPQVTVYFQVLAGGLASILAIVVSITVLSISTGDNSRLISRLIRENRILQRAFVIYGTAILLSLFGVLWSSQTQSQPVFSYLGKSWIVGIVTMFATAAFLHLITMKNEMLDFISSPEKIAKEIRESASYERYAINETTYGVHDPPRLLSNLAQDYLHLNEPKNAETVIGYLGATSRKLISQHQEWHTKGYKYSRWHAWITVLEHRLDPRKSESEVNLYILIFLIVDAFTQYFGNPFISDDGFESMMEEWRTLSKVIVQKGDHEVAKVVINELLVTMNHAVGFEYDTTASNITGIINYIEAESGDSTRLELAQTMKEELKTAIENGNTEFALSLSMNVKKWTSNMIESGAVASQKDEILNSYINALGEAYTVAVQEDTSRNLLLKYRDFFAEILAISIATESCERILWTWETSLASTADVVNSSLSKKTLESIARLLVEEYLFCDHEPKNTPILLAGIRFYHDEEIVDKVMEYYGAENMDRASLPCQEKAENESNAGSLSIGKNSEIPERFLLLQGPIDEIAILGDRVERVAELQEKVEDIKVSEEISDLNLLARLRTNNGKIRRLLESTE